MSPRWEWLWCDEYVERVVVSVSDACVTATNPSVVRRTNAALTAELAVPGFGVNTFNQFGFVDAAYYLGDYAVFVQECVMSHGYQVIVPVPLVNWMMRSDPTVVGPV